MWKFFTELVLKMERDILVTCPYDKAHRIRQYKLTTHMIKCRKQNKDTNKITCPLTNSHVVDHDHLKVCINPYIQGEFEWLYHRVK